MMASRLLKKPKGDMEAKRRRSKAYNNFEKSVKWSLNHRAIILTITAFLLVISTLALFRVGTEFLPATDEGFVTIAVRLENGSSFTATDEVVKRIEKELQKEKDIEVYVSFVGGNQEGQSRGTSRSNIAEIYVKLVELKNHDRSIFTFVDEIQPKVVKTVGENVEVNFNMQSASGLTKYCFFYNVFN